MEAKRRIVLVEDDVEVTKVAEQMLSGAGYQVASTNDPTRALDVVREAQPDLVVCDITMPVMDGYAVLRALQEDAATAHVPVVFLSGQRDFNERVRAFRFGVVDYVTKPFTRETLVRRVERILEGRARRPGARVPSRGPEEAEPSAARHQPLRFDELDHSREDSMPHDPPSLPGEPTRLPDFEELPEVMRDVLIVDDNAAFRHFLRDLLGSRGFRVHEAADGEEGLRLALERRPWLILTDIRMPRADGFELCRRVRSHSLIRQTPVLFLSGWDDYKQRYHGLELGADDFLSKETSIRELLIRIQLLMRRYVDLGGRAQTGATLEGQIQAIGAPAVLQICHLSRLTGTLTARDGGMVATVRFRDGELVGAECAGETGTRAIFAFVAWEYGRYAFAPGDPGAGVALADSFDALLLEGCRRLDEARRGEDEPA